MVLLLVSSLARAQVPGASQLPSRVLTEADTVQALHDLFRQHRQTGRACLGLFPLAVAGTAYSASQIEIDLNLYGGFSSGPSAAPLVGTFLGGATSLTLLIVAPITLNRNHRQREARLVTQYLQGQSLPKRWQKQLHRQLMRAQRPRPLNATPPPRSVGSR